MRDELVSRFDETNSVATSLLMTRRSGGLQHRPQGLLLDDFQNGGSAGEDPGKGWVTWYKMSKNL